MENFRFFSTADVNIPRMTVIDIFILRSVVAFVSSRFGFFCSFPQLGKVTEVFRAQVRLRLPLLLLCVLQYMDNWKTIVQKIVLSLKEVLRREIQGLKV
jgi:hypothetical protein